MLGIRNVQYAPKTTLIKGVNPSHALVYQFIFLYLSSAAVVASGIDLS